jgi:hypothetical protein
MKLSIKHKQIMYNQIKFAIDDNIPIEQAGFRVSRSCVDQINVPFTHIEHGFEENEKRQP